MYFMYISWLILFVYSITNAAEVPLNNEKSQWDFQQNDYDIKLERAQVISFNHSYFKYLRADLVPFNRTQRVLNATIESMRDLPSNKAKLDIQVYKFMSNEYRFFPITITVNPCEEYLRNSVGCREILNKISNFKGCPVKSGVYVIANGLPDISRFPPFIPRGQYKMTTIWHNMPDIVAEIHFYGSVLDKPKKWN